MSVVTDYWKPELEKAQEEARRLRFELAEANRKVAEAALDGGKGIRAGMIEELDEAIVGLGYLWKQVGPANADRIAGRLNKVRLILDPSLQPRDWREDTDLRQVDAPAPRTAGGT